MCVCRGSEYSASAEFVIEPSLADGRGTREGLPPCVNQTGIRVEDIEVDLNGR